MALKITYAELKSLIYEVKGEITKGERLRTIELGIFLMAKNSVL